jgi:hypothetical protein
MYSPIPRSDGSLSGGEGGEDGSREIHYRGHKLKEEITERSEQAGREWGLTEWVALALDIESHCRLPWLSRREPKQPKRSMDFVDVHGALVKAFSSVWALIYTATRIS